MLTVLLAVVLIAVSLVGCSSTEKETIPKGKNEILRKAVLGGAWQMYQMRITLEPVYINESGTPIVQPPTPIYSRAEDMAVVTPISPGELEITVNVQIVYSIR